MVEKKNPKLDTKKYTGLFFNIGLVVSLATIIMAFEWKTPLTISKVENPGTPFNGTEIIEPPPTVVPPPPKPKVEVFNLVERQIEEDIEEPEIDVDIFTDESSENNEPVFVEDNHEEVVDNTVYVFVQKNPQFHGKDQAEFIKYIGSKINYPPMARRMGIEGKVFAQFVIDKDGSMTDIQIIKGIGAGCDEEVLRVLKEAPKWEPGKQRGVPVKVRMIVPVTFTLTK